MIRIRYLIFGFFLVFFLLTLSLLIYFSNRYDISNVRNWENFYIESKVKGVDNYLLQEDKKVRELIETIQTICATKVVNTNDRILLNALFIPMIAKEKYVKSVQIVLPNKSEYSIFPCEKGWKTIYQVPGERGLLRKRVTWAEDGIQMLEEDIEEAPLAETLTVLEWYKKSTEVALTQPHYNRRGTPKIWIGKPTFDENDKSIISLLAIAVGYEDAPFTAVCITMDWSWLQNALDFIYKEHNIETFVLKDKLILGRVGLNYGSIDRKTFEEYAQVDKLPEYIRSILDNFPEQEKSVVYRDLSKIVVVFMDTFLYDFPLLCVCQIPVIFSGERERWKGILLVGFIELVVAVMLSIVVSFLFEKPLEKATHWLENPTEREFSAKDFVFSEYHSLINKFNHILRFLKPLYVSSTGESTLGEDIKDGSGLVASFQSSGSGKEDKDIFIFSEDGVGGVTLQVFENLQRENIRLQKQIEILNSFYSAQLSLGEMEKSKYINYLTAIKESIMVVRKGNEDPCERLTKCLSILNSVMEFEYSIVFRICPETRTVSGWLSVPKLDIPKITYVDLEDLLESISWSEVVTIRSISQDYRTCKFSTVIGGKSLIVSPIIDMEGRKLILFSISSKERNWESREEIFMALMSKILGMCGVLDNLDREILNDSDKVRNISHIW